MNPTLAQSAEEAEQAAAPVADKPAEVVQAFRLRELFLYDPATGAFVNRVARGSLARAGQVAGSKHCAGYLAIRIDGRAYLCHRLAWLYMHGEWPADQIDHINGVRTDNRIENLRECSNAENCQNVRAHRDSTSSFTGVSWSGSSKSKPWVAQICVNKRQRFLGYYATESEAASVRAAAKSELHSFHPQDNSQ